MSDSKDKNPEADDLPMASDFAYHRSAILSHLDIVLNSLTDHAILTLDPDGNITSWNHAAELTKGYTEAEILGKNFSCFYELEDQRSGLPNLSLKIAKSAGRHEMQGWRIRKTGEKFWAHVVIQPLKDKGNRISGYVKVTRDISQVLELEKLRDRNVITQKNELVARLVGGIAHNFNNLLTAVDAGNHLIRRISNSARVDNILDLNTVATDRSKKLIAQLLAFTGKQVFKLEVTNVNDLISVFDELVIQAVGENIKVEWSYADVRSVRIDQGQLQSALLNLIFNARDAMPNGGVIKVFSEMAQLNSANSSFGEGLSPGEYVVVGVSDTGVGMSTTVLKSATEPFFTTKDVGKGIGLGLSQSYGFTRQAGGALSIESEEGVGTTVRMFFPVSGVSNILDRPNAARTILLVDDEYAIRDLVGEMLRSIGHTVFVAEDANDALDQLKKNLMIDFLFTDIIMPGDMNGLQLVEAARRQRPGLQALLASGYSREALQNLAQLRDDVAFLQKPYNISQLSNQFGIASIGTVAK